MCGDRAWPSHWHSHSVVCISHTHIHMRSETTVFVCDKYSDQILLVIKNVCMNRIEKEQKRSNFDATRKKNTHIRHNKKKTVLQGSKRENKKYLTKPPPCDICCATIILRVVCSFFCCLPSLARWFFFSFSPVALPDFYHLIPKMWSRLFNLYYVKCKAATLNLCMNVSVCVSSLSIFRCKLVYWKF